MFRSCVTAIVTSMCLLVGGSGLVQDQSGKAQLTAAPPAAAKHDFGFTAAFEDEVKRIGQITPDEFAKQFGGKATYLPKISWDPTTAKYWDLFTLDPNEPKAMKPIRNVSATDISNLYDFRLNDKELTVFKDKGFVVSERSGSHSFTDLYYRLYVRDLPVFVTSDSMLHAWHRYFDRLLEGLEIDYFQPAFKQMLGEMSAQIPAARKEYAEGPMSEALADVDFFLAVAGHLLQPGSGASQMGQEERIGKALEACHDGKMEEFNLFGRLRPIDFSQFKPRGRYDQTEPSKNYFRALMWLGRIDFRIAGGESADQDLRELAGAIVLNDLLKRAKATESWQGIDRALLQIIGKADSLNFSQLGVVLDDVGITADKATPASLTNLRQRILQSKIGEQHIRGEWFRADPKDPRKFELPRTFAFMGQRFILDSFALSKIVYDDIFWDKEKVQRRIPSCLDVSFAIFGNDHVVPALTQRMKDKAGKKFRDGLPYQHNLAAVRNVVDKLPETTWKESLYADWLGCLRELSKPTTDAKYPEVVKTSAWAMKTTATQLASWTQLRHDTVLYAKPSYSTGQQCEYPAGYVEPVPHFWRRFEDMVQRTKSIIGKMSFPDTARNPRNHPKARHLEQLEHFVNAAEMLRGIAEKELAQQELNNEETKFLKEVVVSSGGSGRPPVSGWYPNLFSKRSDIKSQDDAHKWVALVTDIHTDPPFPLVNDPGCVLHQAVGNVDFLLIAIDNGKDRMVYAGPVFSHYEFETPNAFRRTNGDWYDELRSGKTQPRPEWTSSFVAPGLNPEAKEYGKEDKRWGK